MVVGVVINNSNNYVRFEVFTASKCSKIFSGHVSVEPQTIIRVDTSTLMMETENNSETLLISSTLTWLIG
jgi:hypothetical protein